MKKDAASKDYQKRYDEHILNQGMQFQIDTYYEPKAEYGKRKRSLILGLLEPGRGEKIIDIGCGVGTWVYNAARYGAEAYGVDYSEESIRMARQLIKRFDVADKTKLFVADGTRLPFEDGFFDKATAIEFIEHINLREKDIFLQELYRVLKPGGIAVISTPNGVREGIGERYWKLRRILFKNKVPENPLHFGITTRQEFEKLLKERGFEFRLIYADTVRPYLAALPLLKRYLALRLVWVATKPRQPLELASG
jgi:ubiquinone/menaquinone biosynthesis C-methylase UbiE